MKKFIIKFLFITVLTIVLCSFFDKFFNTYIRLEETLSLFSKQNTEIQLMFFGSSHAQCSYDTRVFEAELGINTMNFNSPSQKLETTDILISEVIDNNKIGLLIIDIFSNSIIKDDSKKQTHFQLYALDLLPNSFKKIRMMDTLFGRKNLPYSISSTIRYHNKWNELNDKARFNRKLFVGPLRDYYNGFSSTLTYNDDNSIEKDEGNELDTLSEIIPQKLTKQETVLLDRFLNTLNNTKTPYMFVNAPSLLVNTNPKYVRYTTLLKEYFKEKNVVFLDLNEYTDSLKITKKHYRDAHHLNQKGALIVSKFLSNYIKEKYSFTKSKLPSKHYNRYRHIREDFVNAQFLKKVSLNIDGNNIKQAVMYRVMGEKYEVLFELETPSFKPMKVNFQYILSKEDLRKYPEAELVNEGVNEYTMNLTDNEVITYNGRTFVIASLLYPLKDIEELVLFATNSHKSILTIANNEITENIYDTEKLVFEQEINKTLTPSVYVKHVGVFKKKQEFVFRITFSDSLKFSDKQYNVGVQVFPIEEERHLLKNSTEDKLASFEGLDKKLIVEDNILDVFMRSNVEHIQKVKIFLYDREGYKGSIGEMLWIENNK